MIVLVIFLGLVYVCRSNERISRLDFLWKLQASKELQDMRALRHYNTQLLENILPDHVAAHFLQDERNTEELYAKSYPCVAVLFASIPNFSSFYSEDVNNGMECIRLLNEIIFDFDQLLENEQFRSIEKVKTISSTYLAACGLNPRDQSLPPSYHLSTCCSFAFAMKRALNEVNVHSFNNFVMRIGISHGPLVGGVIGAKKPVFDIWGDTVNEASRMDSTGTLDMIQVPKRSAVVLASEGFLVQCRGIIQVKGKGEMETYYVLEKSSPARTGQQRQERLDQQAAVGNHEPSPPPAPPVATCRIIEPKDDGPNRAEMEESTSGASNEETKATGESAAATAQEGSPRDQPPGRESKRTTANKNEPPSQHLLSVKATLSSPDQRHHQSGESLQRRRLNRYSRTAQSLRDPGALRRSQRRRQHGARLELRYGNDLEMGEISLGAATLTPESAGSRIRAISPLDLVTRDRIMQLQEQAKSSASMANPAAANNSEENSLTAVVYNMVQMRKSYDPSIANRLAATVGSQLNFQASGSGGGLNQAHHHHNYNHAHQQPSVTRKGNDLNSEAAKLVADAMNDPLSSTLVLPAPVGPKRFKHSSMIARASKGPDDSPDSPPNRLTNSKRKSASRLRSSLFRRRTNYRRTGTSAASDYGTTEPSINELD